MRIDKTKKKFYRKVNTTAHGARHKFGEDSSAARNTKQGITSSMKQLRRGLDYTPLYKFLLKSVGRNWNDVYSEAVSKLDSNLEGIQHLLDSENDFVRCGESTYYSALIIQDGVLQKKNPEFTINDMKAACKCCTHTFNGKVFK